MLIERPPRFFRRMFPQAVFRVPTDKKEVFITFDDGPIPRVTPWVLDILDRYGVKATFFMVGQNVERFPHLLKEVKRRGHDIGNHTLHHLQGVKVGKEEYLEDVAEANRLIGSDMFRPPHGMLRRCQLRSLSGEMHIVMYDLVTRDYSRRLTAKDVVKNVKRYARPGSIIVFHDSRKSIDKLHSALPECLEWLKAEGYSFGNLREALERTDRKE